MPTVRDITLGILKAEGDKFVNDPNDPGGPTKDGVTLATMQSLGLDLNHDGTVNVLDVQLMTADLAAQIFEQHYYKAPHIDMLPQSIQANVYDMQVNAGSNAVMILQSLATEITGMPLLRDGKIGPLTLKAVRAADAQVRDLNDRYSLARLHYYYSLANRNSNLVKYVVTNDGQPAGWIRRAESFMDPSHIPINSEENRRFLANPNLIG